MAKVPAFDKAPAISEIRVPLAPAGKTVSSVAAPMASRSVPAAGLPLAAPPAASMPAGLPPAAMPPAKAVPVSELDDAAVPAARPLAVDAAPVANAAPLISRALASFDAVPAR